MKKTAILLLGLLIVIVVTNVARFEMERSDIVREYACDDHNMGNKVSIFYTGYPEIRMTGTVVMWIQNNEIRNHVFPRESSSAYKVGLKWFGFGQCLRYPRYDE